MPRPAGARNVIPGTAETRALARDLREQARRGDAMSKAALIYLSHMVGRALRDEPTENPLHAAAHDSD